MMFLLRIALTALASLGAHLVRSSLATLGVLVGVGAVIVAMSTIEGATHDVLTNIGKIGPNVLTILPGARRPGSRAIADVESLKYEDAVALEQNCAAVAAASPEVTIPSTVKFYSKNINTTVVGTNEQYAAVRNYSPAEGHFITREDVRGERRVAVLGHKAARDLCGEGSALGLYVRIRNQAFLVVGVMEEKGTIGFTPVDRQVYIPVTTAMKRVFGAKFLTNMSVAAVDAERTDQCQQQVKKALRQLHRIPPGNPDDFTIFSQEDILKSATEISRLLGVVSFTIAGVSLLVGGIGIMNIMLVSVTERTREIGVRMAVGAQPWHILLQFLVEALMVCLLGGTAGIGLGYAGCDLLTQTTPLKTITSPNTLVLAVVVAALTGVFSGLYPAYKASRLDPVEALRYE
jgi:putative ABC transport system permease protein